MIAPLLAWMSLLLSFGASAEVIPNVATITFSAPVARVDGSPITGAVTYHVYQGVKGQAKAKVGTIGQTSATLNTGLLSDTEYCWHVTAQEAGKPESAPSNEDCKAFGPSAAQRVTITVQ